MRNDTRWHRARARVRALLLMSGLFAGNLASGCIAEVGATDEPEAELETGEHSAALTRVAARSLAAGTRETLVTGIIAAENQLFSSAGRLYVSGDNGVFELKRTATGVAKELRVAVAGCKFGGMTERTGTLYAACYDGTQSYVYGATENDAPSFVLIYTLADVTLANGMTSDASSLFVSATGQGRVVRLQLDPADPLRVRAELPFMDDTGGLLPNGVKVYAGRLYWGDFGTIRRTPIDRPTTLDVRAQGLTFFDDFSVDDTGILVADYLFGSVHQYSHFGFVVGSAPWGTFNGPSSVLDAKGRLGFTDRDLVVTEKGADSVSVFHY